MKQYKVTSKITTVHYVDYYVLAESDYEEESDPYNEEVFDYETIRAEVVGDEV